MVDEAKLRMAFDKIKKDMDSLKAEISQIKGLLEDIKSEARPKAEAPKSEDPEVTDEDFEGISTGNQGVLSKQINEQISKQANEQSKQINKQTSKPAESRKFTGFEGLEGTFKSLTRQEFHIFLLIYQLEEEAISPTYSLISTRLSLTSSCLRAHLCSILKKGAPVTKTRLRDNSVILLINKDFKAIASQKKLIDFYYSIIDPAQRRLTGL